MTMWDDLMNTFTFPRESIGATATHQINNNNQHRLLKYQQHSTNNTSSGGSGPSSPGSHPCSPHISHSQTRSSPYIFPGQPNRPLTGSASSGAMDRRSNPHYHQQQQQRQLARSTSNKDLKQECATPELEAAILAPQMRQRVYTYAGPPSNANVQPVIMAPHPVVVQDDSPIRRNTGPNKRRATCPDSMKNHPRPRSDKSHHVMSNGSGGSHPSGSGVNNHHNHTHQQQHFPKIEDVDSDISDDTGAPLDLHSSGDASTASDMSYESHLGSTELSIIRQPESHHRARYQKEGSRGCIKDRTGNSCPSVQLKHYVGPAVVLQAFIGTESGVIRPHPLYRVCKVGGKHSTPCRERVLDSGITALEMDMTRDNNYTLNVDCLGIMKLRNADFEQVFEAEDLAKRRKRSPKVRLVFRAVLVLADGRSCTLQVISTPICCTPSPGVPEIHFISHPSCPATGGTDIVVIGRNFVKDDSRLFLVEKNQDDAVVWEREVPLLQENFNQVHLVGSMPPFRDVGITKPVELSLCVRNKGGKHSEPQRLLYMPDESNMSTTLPAFMPSAAVHSPPPKTEQPTTTHTDTPTFSPYPCVVNGTTLASLPVIQMPHDGVSQNVQYCIQLPGSLTPIIITVPQTSANNLTGQMLTPDSYHGLANTPQLSDAAQATRQQSQRHRNSSQESFSDGDLYTYAGGSQTTYPSHYESPPILSGASSSKSLDHGGGGPNNVANPGTSDEDLFNELLKEILGSSDQSSLLGDFGVTGSPGGGNGGNGAGGGGGGGGGGAFMNVYNSPVQSPASRAALSAARSFHALDIRGSDPNNSNHNSHSILEEEQEDFMS